MGNMIDGSSHIAWWEMWWMTAKTPATPFWFLPENGTKSTMMNDFYLIKLHRENVAEGKIADSRSMVGTTTFTMWSRFTKHHTASPLLSWQEKKIMTRNIFSHGKTKIQELDIFIIICTALTGTCVIPRIRHFHVKVNSEGLSCIPQSTWEKLEAFFQKASPVRKCM